MSDNPRDNKLLKIKMEEELNRVEILNKTFEKLADTETSKYFLRKPLEKKE